MVRARPAFTLVEVLIATAITLLLMAGIVTLFATVSESVSRGQAMMETVDRVRGAQHRLQTDLKYVTAPLRPTLDPRNGLGYFEYIEGPGPFCSTQIGTRPINSESASGPPAANAPWPSPGDDTTVGALGDVLMFTARSYGEPFIGKFTTFDAANKPTVNPIQSQVAEICWFMRGTTLYRRVLLVVPERIIPTSAYSGMYYHADVSVHQEGGPADSNAGWGTNATDARLVANSLGDLTKRENRYGHVPRYAGNPIEGYPHDARVWGPLGLPTLRESSGLDGSNKPWPFPLFGTTPTNPASAVTSAPPPNTNDYWLSPYPWTGVDPETGTLSAYVNNPPPRTERVTEDVILNNVLSFDVKVWDPWAPVLVDSGTKQVLEPGDPGYRKLLDNSASAINTWVTNGRPTPLPTMVTRVGAYVDLFYARGTAATTISNFSGPGNARSQLQATPNGAAVWDSFSTHYESDGVDQDSDGLIDEGTDGVNNDPSINKVIDSQTGNLVVENNMAGGANGGVDDDNEKETAPPYEAPIRSIQIKIRVFERDTRQIREVTVTQDFVP